MNDIIKNKILDISKDRLLEVAQQFMTLERKGNTNDYQSICPHCKSRKFTVCSSKNLFRCFSCQDELASGKGAAAFLMKTQSMGYSEALEYLARYFSIDTSEPEAIKKVVKKNKDRIARKDSEGNTVQSFCARMLEDSGLTFMDVSAKVFVRDENRTQTVSPTFFPGTINAKGEIDRSGDDAIIAYFDIEGNPVTYEQKDFKGRLLNKSKEYYRVRWRYPEEHLDKNGKPFKYKSPFGAPTQTYFPERIREMYRSSEPISRLFIQEGEKKAEKSCKHGIPSIGISGIGNIGQERRLPEDVIKLIERCAVKEVVFILDCDWRDISQNIKITDNAERRPWSFFNAVKSYKEYFYSLKNRQIYVEIYFGYVKENELHDKGIDDLLANSLRGRESDLLDDINFAINEKDKIGKWVGLHKISAVTDHKLKEYWGLHHIEAFASLHRSILQELPEFKFGRYRWKFNDKGELVSAQPIDEEERFWDEIEKNDREGNVRKTVEFKYRRSHIFLNNRGYGRYRKSNGEFEYIRIVENIVETISTHDIFDYVYEFTLEHTSEPVIEMIIRGGTQYLGPDKMSKLPYLAPNFVKSNKDVQRLYFSNCIWEIKESRITQVFYNNISHSIWATSKKDYSVELLKTPLLSISDDAKTGNLFVKLTPTGDRCHFLKFLQRTSDFTWRTRELIAQGQPITIDPNDEANNNKHLLSKLCSIGYMLFDYKEPSKARAVIAMDGKLSEVGASNGRTGKSLIAELFKRCCCMQPINGKAIDLTDRFVWDGINERTRIVAIDDVKAGFDFEQLFPNITTDWNVNAKQQSPFVLPFDSSPKIYITTNHAIKGDTGSFRDRQWLIAFSDYYSDERKPSEEFGQLFSDWDYEQYNLFWNMIAACIQLYMIYGYVPSPSDRTEVRRLRQEMTEEFLDWAENYYSDPSRFNQRIPRKELYDNYLEETNTPAKYCSTTVFKKRIKKYCEYKGYILNPHKYDPVTGKPAFFDKDGRELIDDKQCGIEYFSIGSLDQGISAPSPLSNDDFNLMEYESRFD